MSDVVFAVISVGTALGLLQLAIGGFMLAVWREARADMREYRESTRADMREFERAMRAIGYDVAAIKSERFPPSNSQDS